ncbi:MAG: hypothetical protein OEV40_03755 [Acidimicrobiia bacterium]|nr:hypothetical protein [Acidimicrobiia bacterium]
MQSSPTRLRAASVASALSALIFLAAGCGESSTETDAAGSATDDAAATADPAHDHGDVVEVPDGMAVPAVSLEIAPDPVSGFNLFIDLEDFEISPRNASTEPVDGEGHLHLYIDGERQLRFYNTALHLTDLAEGEHEIAVEVSANNHAAYAVDGTPIRATATVTVEGGEPHHGDAELYEIDAVSAPAMGLEVFADPKSGWNLFADTDLTFAPEASGSDPVDGEGHLHLYVDGEREGRLYGPWWHLSSLPEGEHEITIEASANNHAAYAVDSVPVRASTMITVSPEQAAPSASDEHGADGAMADSDGDESHGADADAAAGDDGLTIGVEVAGDTVEVESSRFAIPLGSTVTIVVEADRADHVHVHGYDHLVDTAPDEPAEVVFVADVPGVFEVELEEAGLFLFELAVGP